MNTTIFRLAATSAIAAACLTACGGGGGGGGGAVTAGQSNSSPTQPAPPAPAVQFGTAKMSLAGEPSCGYDAVNVTVTKMRFNMSATAAASDPGWTEIAFSPSRRVNLSQMGNGATLDLGSAALAPGHYNQLRLVLDQNADNGTANSVVVAGVEKPLLTQSAAPDGAAVTIGSGFDIANGQTLNLVADFDGCRSVLPKGGSYLIRPVIRTIPTVKNGIDGFIDKALLGANVRVSAQQRGVEIRATQPDSSTGEFMLGRLVPGSYDLVITANGRAAAVIAGINVADDTGVVAINSAAAPISMPQSANGMLAAVLTLVPYSSVEAPFGSATQTFSSGTRVSLRDRVADLGSGFVQIDKLPLTRPSLAVWQAGQPLSFTAQALTKEEPAYYTVSTSAPGYNTSGDLQIQAQ